MNVWAIIKITEDGCCGIDFEEVESLWFSWIEANDEITKDWYKNGNYKVEAMEVK